MILIVVGAVAVGFVWTLIQPRIYSADASAVVQSAHAGEDLGSALAGNSLATSRVTTYVELGGSRSVAQRVIDELGLSTSTQALVGQVSVTNPLNTVSLHVSARAESPEEARDVAEAWVRAMVAEVNLLETGDAATASTVFLHPIDQARLPSSPSSPNVRLALAIAGLMGLLLAIGYAVLRYALDRRIRSADGVESETGIAVVGTIPEEKSFTAETRLIPFDGGISSSSSNGHLFAVAEAMRELRTNVQFMDVDNPPRVIVVTSPLPGDGKSTTSSNLAIALASSGQHVVLIDGDLRRPMISSVFGLVEGAGITDVLAGRAEVIDVAQRIGAGGNLLVIGAGKIPPNPSEVLGSQRMRELLSSLAQQAIVIIDAPPLIPVTDAAVLSHSADGAILVATVGKTTFEVLGKALANLERAGARALGVVLNRVPRRGSGAAYYGYQYYGDYYRSDVEATDEDEAAEPVATRSAGASRSSRRVARR